MNKLFTILLVLLFYVSNLISAPVIPLNEVTPEGGVAITSVMCINEDDLGFIWFGTNNGLFRYNTQEIRRYSYSQSDNNTIPTNRINQILRDARGQLFIATENGICKYNPVYDNFSRLEIKDRSNQFIGTDIISLVQTSDGQYWMLDEKGVAKINLELSRAEYIIFENRTSRARMLYKDSSDNLWVVFQDGAVYYKTPKATSFDFFVTAITGFPRAMHYDNNNVWIGYDQGGLLCYDLNGKLIKHYSSKNHFLGNRIRSIINAVDGNLWVGTYNGVAIIKDFKVVKKIQSDNYPHLPNQSIWSLYKDSNDIIWIGTWLGGLCYYSEFNKPVFHTTSENNNNTNKHYIVTTFAQDPDGIHIWLGTESGNLNKYNQVNNRNEVVEVWLNNKKVKNIRTIAFDKYDRLWIGTRGDGIIYKEKNAQSFKLLKTPFPTGLQTQSILPVNNGIWISDYQQGVFFFEFESEKFTRYQHNPLKISSISDKHVRKIIEDSKGNVWFATQNGLNVLKKGGSDFIHFFHIQDNRESLAEDYNYSIHEDAEGNIWLGTNGSGLDKLNPSTLKFEHFTKNDGLPGNDVYAIVEDNDSNLWLSTDNGICRFNPYTKDMLTFGNIDGIYNNSFNPGAALFSNQGNIFFGGSNGYVHFNPNDILNHNKIQPKTIITELRINNQLILPEQENEILTANICYTESLQLHHSQNSFSFNFVATNFVYPDKNKFKYRLKGFDSWIESGSNGSAIFTNVPPGRYTFEVVAANNDGVWNDEVTTMAITIIPPIWARWYAFVFYGCLTIAIILYLRNETIKRQRLKNEIALEKVKRESEESLHQVKLQFFTNISHEFRTPLTLIMGPINRLINNYKFEKTVQDQLNLINSNSKRLLMLINQILDFRKIESGKLSLRPVNLDVVAFTKEVFECFSEHARHRSFEYVFHSESPELFVDFDPEKLDKVIFNILSNAFKYSSDGGIIRVSIRHNSEFHSSIFDGGEFKIGNTELTNFFEILITDAGIGIEKEKLPAIFERFNRLDNSQMQGSGIGLSLTKDYINLHNGALTISSTLNKGTAVSVKIPVKQNEAIQEKNIESSSLTGNIAVENEVATVEKKLHDADVQYNESLILIVEDNPDLLDYLGNLLSKYFKVAKARNGREGVEQVQSLYPDLIISDIMMPEMDGIELCNMVKCDIQSSHIPIVLLTALETVKDRISGLHAGADAYMPKPFDDNLLLAQVTNLLDSRKVLRETFADNSDSWSAKVDSMDMDKKLILKATQFVESNLSNVDLTVDTLASELNLSRTTLHRKLKSLTDQSATEFIRLIRLKNAVNLMKEGKYKVNEIGYAVGFNSHNYFTTSFTKQYGMSPSEFIKKNSLKT